MLSNVDGSAQLAIAGALTADNIKKLAEAAKANPMAGMFLGPLSKMKGLAISLKTGTDLEVKVHVEAESADTAKEWHATVTKSIADRKKADPSMADVKPKVEANGAVFSISVKLTQQQIMQNIAKAMSGPGGPPPGGPGAPPPGR